MYFIRCFALPIVLACRAASGEWTPIPEHEVPQVLQLAESALETQWNACSRGWCKGITHHSPQSDGSGGPMEIEVAWDKQNVCLLFYRCEIPISVPPKFHSTLDDVQLYTPHVVWSYSRVADMFFGNKRTSSTFIPEWDIRPQEHWLKVSNSQTNHREHLEMMKKRGIHGSRSDDGRVQIYARGFRMEFDTRFGFGLVLFEYAMETNELLDAEKTTIPERYRYELASDAHGVWYCKDVMHWYWPAGGGGDPVDNHIMTISAYDSAPPPEKMRFDYKSMPIPLDTRVISMIPGKSGQWVFGKEKGGGAEIEGARFRNLGNQMRTRGFSHAERGMPREQS
jgi:hypothetical protein